LGVYVVAVVADMEGCVRLCEGVVRTVADEVDVVELLTD
jgi:hypothetical protein